MKGAVLQTKVNVNRLKVYKCPDERKESNEEVAAHSEKNGVEENRTEDGSNEESGMEVKQYSAAEQKSTTS